MDEKNTLKTVAKIAAVGVGAYAALAATYGVFLAYAYEEDYPKPEEQPLHKIKNKLTFWK